MSSKSTKFIYMGDPQPSRLNGAGPDYSQWGRLLHMSCRRAYGNENGEGLLLLGGDLVNRGTRENRREEWEAFFEAGGDLLDNLKVASPESFFSFDYGCCHFLVLNSEYMGTRQKAAYKYIGNWIRDDLQESDRGATFVLMHHPMYTVGTSFGDDVLARTMQDNYMKLFLKYRVDFILCGHQHLYCRTREMGTGEYPMVQLMGVSGTKFFEGWNLQHMVCSRQNEAVATVFEVTEDEIRLETINLQEQSVDTYAKAVNRKPKKDCSKCPKFETCKGLKAPEAIGAGLSMDKLRELMSPEQAEGTVLTVKAAKGLKAEGGISHEFSLGELEMLEHEEFEYSVMRRGRLEYEKMRGIRIELLFDKAGLDRKHCPSAALLLTNSEGMVKGLKLEDVLQGGRYDRQGGLVCKVPAIITDDFRLVFGQTDAGQYNGSRWIRDIKEIEISTR